MNDPFTSSDVMNESFMTSGGGSRGAGGPTRAKGPPGQDWRFSYYSRA